MIIVILGTCSHVICCFTLLPILVRELGALFYCYALDVLELTLAVPVFIKEIGDQFELLSHLTDHVQVAFCLISSHRVFRVLKILDLNPNELFPFHKSNKKPEVEEPGRYECEHDDERHHYKLAIDPVLKCLFDQLLILLRHCFVI